MVRDTDLDDEEFTMVWLMVNVPLMVLFFALWAGIPAWLVLRRPDTNLDVAAPAGISSLPARRHDDLDYLRVA